MRHVQCTVFNETSLNTLRCFPIVEKATRSPSKEMVKNLLPKILLCWLSFDVNQHHAHGVSEHTTLFYLIGVVKTWILKTSTTVTFWIYKGIIKGKYLILIADVISIIYPGITENFTVHHHLRSVFPGPSLRRRENTGPHFSLLKL